MSDSKVTSHTNKGQASSSLVGPLKPKVAARQPLQDRKTSNKAKSSQASLISSKGFLQISKEAKKAGFTVFDDENADANQLTKAKAAPSVATVKASTPKSKLNDTAAQTDISGDYGSVVGGDHEFYQGLAEKRRLALDETLKENESLVDENVSLKYENQELKTLNESLHESLEKASKTIELMESILNCKEDASDDEKEEEEQETDAEAEPSKSDEETIAKVEERGEEEAAAKKDMIDDKTSEEKEQSSGSKQDSTASDDNAAAAEAATGEA